MPTKTKTKTKKTTIELIAFRDPVRINTKGELRFAGLKNQGRDHVDSITWDEDTEHYILEGEGYRIGVPVSNVRSVEFG